MIRRVLTTLAALAALMFACAPAPAQAVQPGLIPASSWSVSSISWTPKVTPASQRRIEVVDQLKPTKWKVSQAAEWVDRYTASNMVTVSRCSGRAWKCVYVRGGKLGSNWLAVTRGNVITVDTAKVDRKGYRSNYSRERILAHEIVHTFGYKHGPRHTLMAPSIGSTRLYLNASQRKYLRAR